nr:immunoglobulin heavy chain junction region [Macaca mulatta]MOW87145.1 immunoglobulin heavy chain junction region [Macaca mulatta]MOW88049.1 immunoglobulin heavy chain junction region [Macaca mulatta]MOW89889.1 immunoglobulin heavy chain junction region [Macaca mulatta]MOW90300.1 immunoglobulin heavy chain junction region [Macaca mulatta]
CARWPYPWLATPGIRYGFDSW